MDWKKIVGGVAPLLGTALGGPGAGAAVSAVATALGLAPDASESDVEAAVKAMTPDQHVELEKANFTFEIDKLKQENERLKVLAGDTADARAMYNARDKDDHLAERLAYFVVAAVALLLVGVMLMAVFGVNPATIFVNLLFMLSGAIMAQFERVYSFFFGSSLGSKKKDSHIEAMNKITK